MRAFPLIRDLVTDVSWNYEVNKTIAPFTPPADVPQEDWRWQQEDIERVQEYRKCIECFLCQDVCHVLRNHETEQPFMGPRFLVRVGRPRDAPDRRRPTGAATSRTSGGIGYCNITKCCTEVCPEHIKITDNAIIPLKERVADALLRPDPVGLAQAPRRRVGRAAPAGPSCRSSQGDAAAAADRRRRPGARLSDPLFPDARARRPGEPPAPRSGPTRGFVIRTDGAARGNPGPGSLGAALYRPRAARRARRPGAPRTPRSPTTSASRPTTSPSTRASSGRSSSPASSGPARSTCCSIRSSSSSSSPAAGGSRTPSSSRSGRPRAGRSAGFDRWSAAHVPRALNSVADALANEAIDRVARRRPGVGRAAPGRSEPARRRADRASSSIGPVSEAVGWSRVAGGATRRWREESPSSAAQGGG